MNNILLDMLILILVLYLIARQFMEQEVTMRSLWALPIVIAYYTYTRLQTVYVHFDPTLFNVTIGIAAFAGLVPGLFHGSQMHLRQDQNGRIFARSTRKASLLWLGLLILRIACIALSYIPFEQTFWPLALALALVTTFISVLFLSFIVVSKLRLFAALSQMQNSRQTNSARMF